MFSISTITPTFSLKFRNPHGKHEERQQADRLRPKVNPVAFVASISNYFATTLTASGLPTDLPWLVMYGELLSAQFIFCTILYIHTVMSLIIPHT